MANRLHLTKPTVDLKEEYLSFYREWLESGEDMIPWVIEKDPSNFEGMVQFLIDNENGINLPEGWVPDSTYWLINEDKRIIGVVNIRHQLTESPLIVETLPFTLSEIRLNTRDIPSVIL